MSHKKASIQKSSIKGVDDIDALYGLEPIYEPGSDPRLVPLSDFFRIRCPYCGKSSDISVETIYGNQHYPEDCQSCCQTMEISVVCSEGVTRVSVKRQDEVR